MSKVFRGEIINISDFNKKVEDVLKVIPLHYSKDNLWFKWNFEDFRWEIVDEVDILNSIEEETNIANISQNFINSQIITALKMASRKNKPTMLRNTQVQFKNKIIDVITGEVMEASPRYFTFNALDWEIGESEETPTIDKFIESWVKKEDIKKLYQWLAYQLIPDYPIHRVFIFIGGGSNGKSTFIDLMRRFIGEHNYSAGDFESVFRRRFGTSILYKKLSVLMPEADFGKIDKTATFKAATGGDVIPIEFKNKSVFNFKNYAKVTISANSLPVTLDKTDSFYRRVSVIDFPNKFTEKFDVLGSIPKNEFNNLAKKCLRLLNELMKTGKFDKEDELDKKRELYEQLSNPLSVFIENEIMEMEDSAVSKREFMARANNWLKKRNHRALTDKEITRFMKERFQDGWGSKSNGDGSRRSERVWTGILFKEDYIPPAKEEWIDKR